MSYIATNMSKAAACAILGCMLGMLIVVALLMANDSVIVPRAAYEKYKAQEDYLPKTEVVTLKTSTVATAIALKTEISAGPSDSTTEASLVELMRHYRAEKTRLVNQFLNFMQHMNDGELSKREILENRDDLEKFLRTISAIRNDLLRESPLTEAETKKLLNELLRGEVAALNIISLMDGALRSPLKATQK